MFKHIAVHVQRNMVRKDPQMMSEVPRQSGPDAQPSTIVALLSSAASFNAAPDMVVKLIVIGLGIIENSTEVTLTHHFVQHWHL